MIIVGSTAIRYWLPEWREPKDLDVLSSSSSKQDGQDVIHIPESILELVSYERNRYSDNHIATLDAIYTLKCSHLGWDIMWQKHKNDVLYLKGKGCKVIPELYTELVKHWREVNGNKEFLSMYKKKSDFFNDHVPYVYDHDYLHDLVAFPDKPIYTYCLIEGEDVAIDYEKFKQLSIDDQLRMFKEEISVIAAERWLIPPKICGKYTWHEAYSLALHKTVTALTKNWATDFLIEHLDYFVRPEFEYFEHLFNTIPEGEKIMSNILTNEEVINLHKEIAQAWNDANPDTKWSKSSNVSFSEAVSESKYFKGLDGFELIECEGGEGEGDYAYHVIKWKDNYYRFNYSYASYDGFDYDYASVYKVTPQQRTITVYE